MILCGEPGKPNSFTGKNGEDQSTTRCCSENSGHLLARRRRRRLLLHLHVGLPINEEQGRLLCSMPLENSGPVLEVRVRLKRSQQTSRNVSARDSSCHAGRENLLPLPVKVTIRSTVGSAPEEMMDSQCLGESEGLTFFLARPEDYDDVMAISQDIYKGNDYLPHRYHSWMTEPGRVVIIARRSQKLVALESGLVVDGGDTVVVEGLRVCPSERGRGLAGVVQKFADGYIKNVFPHVKTKRLTRGDNPGPEKLTKFKLLAKRAVLSLCGNAEGFDRFVSHLKKNLAIPEVSISINPLLEVTDLDVLKALLLDPDLPSRLHLPGGALIQDWQPLKLMESNLEVLARRNLTWFVDGSGEKPSFLSFHTPPYPVPYNGGSLRFNIDLFGTDACLAKKALVSHLNNVKGEIQGTVTVHVYMHNVLWDEMKVFCEGHEEVKQHMGFWEQLFLEREFS